MIRWALTSSPRGFVVSSIVRITSICPLPKMLPDHALGIIFRELIGVLRRTAAPVYGLAVVVAFAIFPALAAAQSSDTVYDEAGALSDPEEQRVQQAFDSAQEETGQPL